MNAFLEASKKIMVVILGLLIIITFCVPSYGLTSQSKNEIRVACGINNALYLDEDGNPEGYCATYLDALANVNHWKLKYVEGSFNQSLENLNNGKVDLVFPLQITEDRKNDYEFSSISGGYQPICIYAENNSKAIYNDFDALNGSKIAVTRNSSNEDELKTFAKDNNFTYTPVYLDTLKEKTDALKSGKADYIAASNIFDNENYEIIAVMTYEPFYYAVKKGNNTLLNELNNGMEQLMIQQPEITTNVSLNFLNNGSKVAHSAEENQWIKKDGKIVVGLYQDSPPLYHKKDNEEAHGIYVDILELLGKKMGVKIEIYPMNRDVYGYDLLKKGKIDVIIGSNDTSLKALDSTDYVYSAPIMDYTTVTISRHDYISKDDSAPVYVLTSARKYWEPLIHKDSPKAEIKYVKSAKDCLIAVQDGKADLTLLNAWEFNYQSKNSRFSDLMEWENHRIYGDVVMAAMSNADPTMLSILDKGISELSGTETSEIVAVNLNRQYDDYTLRDRLYTYKNIIGVIIIILVLLFAFFATYNFMRKKYISTLEKNNIQLENANKAKSNFLASMSHDIRTPMNVIIGMCHLASENKNPADTDDCLNKIGISSEFLLGLVNDVLDMERIESGKLTLSLVPYSGEEFKQYIEAVIEPLCNQKNIKFEYTFSGFTDFIILQDKLRINQIYFNILSNAAKYTPEGGQVKFNTNIKRKDDKIHLDVTIADTGIGMSENFQQHMFEPFVQENQDISAQGTGLGLAIVKSLCDMMNMSISVKSELGKGTTFYIHGEYEEVTNVSNNVELNKVSDIEKVSLKDRVILVCEDHPLNQEIITRLLQKEGAYVIIAENGKQGVEVFRNSLPGHIDTILMDIRMPVMGGLQAAKEIRSLSRKDATEIPIIALSANAYEEDIKECKDAGMNSHLAKPIEPDKLYHELRKYLSTL